MNMDEIRADYWKIIVIRMACAILFEDGKTHGAYLAFCSLRNGIIDLIAASANAAPAINEEQAIGLLRLYSAVEAWREERLSSAALLLEYAACAFQAASCLLEARLIGGASAWIRVLRGNCADMLRDLVRAWRDRDREKMLGLAKKMLPRTFGSIYDEYEAMQICEAMILADHASSYLEQ